MKTYILLAGSSFLLSILFTPLVRVLAHRFGWLDQPGERRIHEVPTPRLGGVAIVLSFVLVLLPLLLIHNSITMQLRVQWHTLECLPVAMLAIFLLGLADDVFSVGPWAKLVVEVACSLWVFYHGIFIGLVTNPLGKSFDIGIWSLPITVLWIVGITNAFNLVDGIDGLAAGIALFGMATMVLVSLVTGNPVLIAVLAALGGATAGFLLFNFHPASIFLGDSGSLFLGFTVGVLSLVWGQKSPLAVAVLGPILIFALPIADTMLAIVRRFLGGAPIFASDSDHIHHRLLHLGFSPRKAVLILYGASFFFGLLTLALVNIQAGIGIVILILTVILSWLALTRLGYHELAEISLTVGSGLLHQRTIISQRVQFRKAVELIGEAKTFDDLWLRVIDVARAFNFDRVELSLNPDQGWKFCPQVMSPGLSGRILERSWPHETDAATNHAEKFWRIELSLGGNPASRRYVAFSRAMDKEGLHFRLETFTQQLATNIMKGLTRICENRN
jgi:UDP-GlcNAc:undecaprenyl-phosphate/decaprenyl-phosphate GlcNAc-1-phosphate transferase